MTPTIETADSELALIGAAMYAPGDIAETIERIDARHFSDPVLARVWGQIRAGVTEPTIIAQRLDGDAGFAELGGLRMLADAVDAASIITAPAHAEAILDAALRRELAALADTARIATRHAGGGEALLADMERGLAELAREGGRKDAFAPAGNIVASALAKAKASKGLPGLSTGLTELDGATGGLRPEQLIIVAGRPAMGKSTGALQLAKAIAGQGRGCAFFSLEMPDFDLGLRLACDLVHDPFAPPFNGRQDNPDYFHAARNELPAHHWARLGEAAEQVATWPLAIDTRANLRVEQIRSASRRQFRKWERAGVEPGAVIVDHLGLSGTEIDRGGNKTAETGDISRSLAGLAKDLHVPVIALCQLNRAVEARGIKDRRPALADLRNSGDIEQDARLVMFLYRPEYYLKKPEDEQDFDAMGEWRDKLSRVRHKLFWLIEKNNNGPTGEIETYCNIACSAIRDRFGAFT